MTTVFNQINPMVSLIKSQPVNNPKTQGSWPTLNPPASSYNCLVSIFAMALCSAPTRSVWKKGLFRPWTAAMREVTFACLTILSVDESLEA